MFNGGWFGQWGDSAPGLGHIFAAAWVRVRRRLVTGIVVLPYEVHTPLRHYMLFITKAQQTGHWGLHEWRLYRGRTGHQSFTLKLSRVLHNLLYYRVEK